LRDRGGRCAKLAARVTGSLQKTKVDLTGLMRVLGEALYSTPHVAIRELIQNAHDSCSRRRIESPDGFEPAITVASSPETLVIGDNGAGLTDAEIHAYLATVGAGYTRSLRDQGLGDELIGFFGLGFLSAFAVSERVEVWTCSYKNPRVAHRFVSRSGETYTVDAAESRPVGTEVRLTLRAQFPELWDPDVVLDRLQRYCCLLKHPVSFNGGPTVNAAPPWRLGADISALRKGSLSMQFARRFETTFEPLVTLAVSGDGLEGLLWIQDGASYATSDNRNVSVFVRGMLVSDDERDLLPRWAGFVGGVIESQTLMPTASREALKKDEDYHKTAQLLQRRLLDGLSQVARQDPATWRRILARHNDALLGAAVVDAELFEFVRDDLTVATTEGDLTLPVLLERGAGKIYATQTDQASLESVLLRALRRPVVLGTRYAALAFCSRYVGDARSRLVILGTQGGDAQVFQPADLEEDRIRALQGWFAGSDRQVFVRRFEPAFLPFALVTDRDAQLKRRLESDEADRRIGQAVLRLAREFTKTIDASAPVRMYVNSGNAVIRALHDAPERHRARALALLQPLALLVTDNQTPADLEASMKTFDAALLRVLEGD
jgi:molecular chaperone HtpG